MKNRGKILLLAGFSGMSLLLPACGRMPLPVMEQDVVLMPVTPVNPHNTVVQSAPVQLRELPPADDGIMKVVAAQVPEAVAMAPTNTELSSDILLQQALDSLHQGQQVEARQLLLRIRQQDTAHAGAADLLRQLNEDPAVYFGTTAFFSYPLKKGESLSLLAERFLGDARKFYSLARYNHIDVPAQVRLGQVIRVPGQPPEEMKLTQAPDAAAGMVRSSLQSDLLVARQFIRAGKDSEGIAILLGLVRDNTGNREASALLVDSVDRHVQALVQRQHLQQAEAVLQEAVSLLPDDSTLEKRRHWMANLQTADSLYHDARADLEAGGTAVAYRKLNQVVQLDPEHKQARQTMAAMQEDVVAVFHRQAMTLYRQQELAQAIALWDEVLAIDAEHHLARLYRERALELTRRLEKFKEKDNHRTVD